MPIARILLGGLIGTATFLVVGGVLVQRKRMTSKSLVVGSIAFLTGWLFSGLIIARYLLAP